MLKQVLVATVAASAIGMLGFAAAPAKADNIVLNQWYTGHFTTSNTPLKGGITIALGTHGPILPWPAFGNAVSAPAPAWTITLSHSGTLTVTDIERSGDRFQMFDNGVAMAPAGSPFGPAPQNPGQVSPGGGLTSVPCVGCSYITTDINGALGDADFSSGTFYLHPGVNNITGEFLGVIKYGDFDFIAESGVPEPATWGLMLLGVGAVGGAMRRRSRALPATT
jgi:hypothetical protein